MNHKATAAARLGEIRKAMNRGWNIPDEYFDDFPRELGNMVFGVHEDAETKTVEHNEPGPVRIQAIKLILEMKKQNIAEGLVEDGEENGAAVDNDENEETAVESRKTEILKFVNGKTQGGDDAGGNRPAGSRSRKTAGRKTAAAGTKRTTKRTRKPKS